MDDLYRDYILEHSRRPHNFGVLASPSASHEGANPLCGDRITMQLGIRDGKVAEVAFTGRGCAISQASASLLTDEVKGMTVDQAAAFRADDLLELLGIDISPARLKCAMLSLETLEGAIGELDQPELDQPGTGESDQPGTGESDQPGSATTDPVNATDQANRPAVLRGSSSNPEP